MRKTPSGTSVGVDDPYAVVDRCDHLTDDGRCRYAFEQFERDPWFARSRRDDGYRCPVVADDPPIDPFEERSLEPVENRTPRAVVDEGRAGGDRDAESEPTWADCPHFRRTTTGRTCIRCGLRERRVAHEDRRPLLEEHHLSYRDGGRTLSHEITVSLCRWCHAKVHASWARIDDEVSPSPEALAAFEGRRSKELEELEFSSAAERAGADVGNGVGDGRDG